MSEDVLATATAQIHARLEELRGVVAEYERLEGALKALDAVSVDGSPRPGPSRRRSSERQTRRKRASARTRVSRTEAEQRRTRMLAILAEDPSTPASAFATMFDTTRSNVYGMFRTLEKSGAIRKTSKGRTVRKARA
jgi:hypothetical protein